MIIDNDNNHSNDNKNMNNGNDRNNIVYFCIARFVSINDLVLLENWNTLFLWSKFSELISWINLPRCAAFFSTSLLFNELKEKRISGFISILLCLPTCIHQRSLFEVSPVWVLMCIIMYIQAMRRCIVIFKHVYPRCEKRLIIEVPLQMKYFVIQ